MIKSTPIILSLGGSLVVPNGGIDTHFLTSFNNFIREKIAQQWRFFVVVGGGATARKYRDAGKGVVGSISDVDLDWLGVHATRLNAHLLRTIFQDVAHPRIIENYEHKLTGFHEPLVIAAGWKPGWSTDYCATILARDYDASTIVNLSNIEMVYDKDPNKYTDAKPLEKVTWKEFEKLVGDVWVPGSNLPFDPIATKMAKSLDLAVYVMNGNDLTNLDHILANRSFKGTVIVGK